MKRFTLLLCSFLFILSCSHNSIQINHIPFPEKTFYKTEIINEHKIFYREAGNPKNDVILLLHGYPSSSHMFRELIPMLSGSFHVIAPDNLGSGYSGKPSPHKIKYTFDLLAKQIEGLLQTKKIKRFFIYMQDFGAPVGYRLILNNPSRIKGIIAQNANAYLEGLTEKRIEFFLTAGDKGSKFNNELLFDFVGHDAIINKQYLRDVSKDKHQIMSPDAWTHDLSFLRTRKLKKIQVQLLKDYRTNLKAYPRWQKYLRDYQPPMLITWGKKDPAFMSAGAQAHLEDVPNAELHLLDAGHFALEEMPYKIAKLIIPFIHKNR